MAKKKKVLFIKEIKIILSLQSPNNDVNVTGQAAKMNRKKGDINKPTTGRGDLHSTSQWENSQKPRKAHATFVLTHPTSEASRHTALIRWRLSSLLSAARPFTCPLTSSGRILSHKANNKKRWRKTEFSPIPEVAIRTFETLALKSWNAIPNEEIATSGNKMSLEQ